MVILPSPTLSAFANEARQASLKLLEDKPCSSLRGGHKYLNVPKMGGEVR